MEKDRKDFVDYLKTVKSAVIENDLDKYPLIHIIIGNEACDLDSAISALTYAFHLAHSSPAVKGQTLTVPVLNIPEEDYSLKTELLFALKKEGVEGKDLVFADQLDVTSLVTPRVTSLSRLKITLVDHHVPCGCVVGLEDAVEEIIDHHTVAKGEETQFIKKVKHTIEAVGSCATLIAEKLLATKSPKSKEAKGERRLNTVVANLLRQTIIVDTVNFSSSAKKATPKDVEVVEGLMTHLVQSVQSVQSSSDILREFSEAKADIQTFSTGQLLKKDLKVLRVGGVHVHVSSIPLLVKEYFCTQQRQQELAERCRSEVADALVVLGVSLQGDISRDILIYSTNTICLDKISEGLQNSTSPSLGLETSDSTFCPLSTQYRYFKQGTSSASRKQILPLLAEILQTSSSAISQAITRKPSSDIPETATPPNSFITGNGFLSVNNMNNMNMNDVNDVHSVFTNVNRRILQLDPSSRAVKQTKGGTTGSSLTCQLSAEYVTATPSNTFVDDSGRSLMRDAARQHDQEELQDKMTLLKLRQDESDCCDSPCDLSSISYGDVDDQSREIFEMEDDEGVDRAVSHSRSPRK